MIRPIYRPDMLFIVQLLSEKSATTRKHGVPLDVPQMGLQIIQIVVASATVAACIGVKHVCRENVLPARRIYKLVSIGGKFHK